MQGLYFVLISITAIYVFRKIGWLFSKKVLYYSFLKLSYVILLCVLWGFLIGYLTHLFIEWREPNLVLKIIFGYCAGWYASLPDFGLFKKIKTTLDYDFKLRHDLIGNISMISFGITIILFEILH